ncbi:hypothetical protein [Nonomuraea sp. SBT364]|uniref:hypothetical protein n=1 Tax=Nonomuraea sp. SBT364 TaxID=1580530 RepID=UPI00066C0FEE|nr:hypothetical protein [Nonomuraea sp. SBT364]
MLKEPTTKPATTKPATTKPAESASFSLAYVRVQGSSTIKDAGTCYTGTLNFGVGVDSTKAGASFSYQWVFDGDVIESGQDRLPSGSRSDYLSSKRLIDPPDGPHTVTYRITSPVSRSESLSFTMCPTS